jgi:hypothetical protein
MGDDISFHFDSEITGADMDDIMTLRKTIEDLIHDGQESGTITIRNGTCPGTWTHVKRIASTPGRKRTRRPL